MNERYISNSKRVAKNTIFLYLRTIIIMLISLYTTRIVISSLGEIDYGIYTVVGSFVAMFAIISNSITAAISRFITYELGLNECGNISKVFSTSVILQIFLGIIIIVFVAPIGVWFINNKLSIPIDRLHAANWVFIFSLLTFIINLISVPYNALIVAHERMAAFAYIGIFDAICRLIIAYSISISTFDTLIHYAILMALLAILIRLIYGLYCKRKFRESRFIWFFDKNLVKKIFGFTGWNFIGAAAGVLKEQGLSILLNIFGGPIVSAARGVSVQVTSAVTSFVTNFTTALNPQITKSYASNNNIDSINIANTGSRISFFLLFVLSIPIITETNSILDIWLESVPPYTVPFIQLVLVNSLVQCLSYPLTTLVLANGNIRTYQIIVGGCLLLNLPISYILLKLGFSLNIVFVVSIFVSVLSLILRLILINRIIHEFSIKQFVSSVIWKITQVITIVFIIIYIMYSHTLLNSIYFVYKIVATFIISAAVVILFGLTKSEKAFLRGKILSKIAKE